MRAKTQPPEWADDTMHSIPKNKYVHLKNFLQKRHRTHHGVVAFKNIDSFISSVGDVEVDWTGLLHNCKKDRSEPHLWTSDYWMDSSRKEGISFVQIEDNFVVARGLYKTALARYALHYYGADTVYGVKLSRWGVDWEMYNAWLALKEVCAEKRLRYHLSPEKKRISRYREGHWVVDEFLLTLRCEDASSGHVRTLGAVDARDWLVDLTAGGKAPHFGMERLIAHALAA